MSGQERHCNLKPQRTDSIYVLRRPVETTAYIRTLVKKRDEYPKLKTCQMNREPIAPAAMRSFSFQMGTILPPIALGYTLAVHCVKEVHV